MVTDSRDIPTDDFDNRLKRGEFIDILLGQCIAEKKQMIQNLELEIFRLENLQKIMCDHYTVQCHLAGGD